ncbi:hypothetical protein L7F22_020798 [Adiantum nelumboides]|nr:hypothetical protein [Adiantum nelumboides]
MAVHQLWRFPRGASDLQSMLRESTEKAEIPGLDQLSSEELTHLQDLIFMYHTHIVAPDQSCSMVVQRIKAPAEVVWSVVRRFDNPQAYKHFISSCFMQGDGQVGSTREVRVVSGLPAASSTERLEVLDDERHVLSFKVVGGQHRLRNYFATTTLHRSVIDGCPSTIVIESYVVDVPEGNTREETRVFADTIVRSNLQSLARTSELLVRNARNLVFLQ